MTTKAVFQRVKSSLERERLRLKGEALELEKRQRELERERAYDRAERARAVAALRELCARYGDNDWPDETPLDEVMQEHLSGPLAAGLERVSRRALTLQATLDEVRQRDHERSSGPATPQTAPATRRDEPVASCEGHQVFAVAGGGPTRVGDHWRAVCSCNWRSIGHASQAGAEETGRLHVERMAGNLARPAR